MRFIKDILLVQVETTGPDPDKDAIIQLAAVLLSKDNLLEKAVFNSYVRVSLLEGILSKHAALLNIDPKILQKSQKIYDVVKQFNQQFDSPLLLASHNTEAILFLRNAYKKSLVPFEFDRHIIELWTLGYVYTLRYGMKKMPTFATFLQTFNLQQKNPHDALEKCRLAAEIFKKIIKEA